MGPGIILDKSAVEAIGQDALRIQSSLFYTTVTPILVWEICGDIEKATAGRMPDAKVRALASKAAPFDSIVTTEWRKLCLGELSGHRFEHPAPGNRRPVVEGGSEYPEAGGGVGIFFDEQPEKAALRGWAHGEWTEADHQYSAMWRMMTKSIDVAGFKKRFGPARRAPETAPQLQGLVSLLRRDPSLQYYFLTFLIEHTGLTPSSSRELLRRWSGAASQTWQSRCPFCSHCLKVLLTFYLALSGGVLGDRPTNRIDMEYFFYTPFSPIFVSGDEASHGRLAPLLLEADQVFVRGPVFRDALQAEADRLTASNGTSDRGNLSLRNLVSPPRESLLQQLWIKAWGSEYAPPKPITDVTSEKENKGGQEIERMLNFFRDHPEQHHKRPAWPHP